MPEFDTEINVEESCRLVVAVPKVFNLNASEADDIEAELNKLLREELGELIEEIGGWVIMNNSADDYRYFETNRQKVNADVLTAVIELIPEAYELVNIEVNHSDLVVMSRDTLTIENV